MKTALLFLLLLTLAACTDCTNHKPQTTNHQPAGRRIYDECGVCYTYERPDGTGSAVHITSPDCPEHGVGGEHD